LDDYGVLIETAYEADIRNAHTLSFKMELTQVQITPVLQNKLSRYKLINFAPETPNNRKS
jgi:hypothetical protein